MDIHFRATLRWHSERMKIIMRRLATYFAIGWCLESKSEQEQRPEGTLNYHAVG